MPHYLLTGAGFSRNWGGWLATDVVNYLLGSSELSGPIRRRLLGKVTGGSYEDILADLQKTGEPESLKQHALLTSTLVGMFNEMGNGFMRRQFEFRSPSDLHYSLAAFLERFEAIFTLNQDTLIEQKYLPIAGPPRWGRAHLPGMKFLAGYTPTGTALDTFAVMEPHPNERALFPNIQPYIKLHGSCNWVDGPVGKRILIMGGEKAVSLNQFSILTWYFEQFRECLLRPRARLMIIGYSFTDAHVNKVIFDGMRHGDLEIFIVDPSGVNALGPRGPRLPSPDYVDVTHNILPERIIGVSTRLISSTFNDDVVEHDKLLRFFK